MMTNLSYTVIFVSSMRLEVRCIYANMKLSGLVLFCFHCGGSCDTKGPIVVLGGV